MADQPEDAEYIGPLTPLQELVKTWRGHIEQSDPKDPFTRAVQVCADQLTETIGRMLSRE